VNAAITPAASVLLAAAPGSPETFLVWRAPALRFMGGFVAFPGGKTHDADAPLVDEANGVSLQLLSAVRELFEEAGVLLARREDGSFPPSGDDLSALRRALLDERLTFHDLLRHQRLRLDPRDLTPAGHLVTPPFAPVRFDTAFYVADLPRGQQAEVWPGELTRGQWATAADALAAWQRGEWLLSPPTVSILQTIAGRPVADLPERLRPLLRQLDDGRLPPIWFAPGVLMIPVDCQGLPPTTHTNAYLVGTGPRCLIDPGPTDPGERAKLFRAVEETWTGAGPVVDAVVLSHHHPDHVGAAVACAERYGVPILAHARTGEWLRDRVRIDRFLDDGDVLELGELSLTALLTPGHAPGHLAFHEPRLELLFAGDMVSTLSSIIICPDDGDLALYLASLERLRRLPCRLLLPAHGPPTARAAKTLEDAVAHRAERERQLLTALAAGPRDVGELAREMYRGLPERSMPLAELQVRTGLIKLSREGRAVEGEGRWRLS
jgi:glyoxylase-like metal-dependent hydrolase (beta-lactamase superfamily II)/8-oxo-dGTP pyrophosphatase MutT (NUDIX family)